MKSNVWVEEMIEDKVGLRFKIENTLFSGKSEFQYVDVVETTALGKMLLNDGLIMVTEKDEFVYHDMIAHVPLFVHPNPENVLVIGGGDGGTAREVLRHKNVKKCTMVEIDKLVVDACREHIPQTSCALDDERLTLLFEDGVKFVKNTKEKFDVILVDSTDPIGPATPLFGEEFYRDIYRCLSDDGIVVSQGESPWYQMDMQGVLMKILHQIFPKVRIYNFSNLTYPGGLWSFTFASKGLHPIKDFTEQRVESSDMTFDYYTPAVHRAAFALPQFQLNKIGDYIKE
jgi:spermidine synthase